MSFISILFALLLEQARPLAPGNPVHGSVRNWVRWVVRNLDTGKPILRQNSEQQRYIASLTKMMTALLFLESGKDMNAEITIPTSLTQEFKDIQNANGSTMNLRIGETVRRIDLLYGLLVRLPACGWHILREIFFGHGIFPSISGGRKPEFLSGFK